MSPNAIVALRSGEDNKLDGDVDNLQLKVVALIEVVEQQALLRDDEAVAGGETMLLAAQKERAVATVAESMDNVPLALHLGGVGKGVGNDYVFSFCYHLTL